jgi:membrane associated rhomboid family serine protease
MAFFHEGPSRQPILNAPASVLWLIAAILLAHAARAFAPPEAADQAIATFGFIPARYSQGFWSGGALSQLLPFISYMFVHADFGHAGINCLWLLAFGPAVARRLGWLRFYLFFAFCGVLAALAHLAANWGSDAPAVGASGAVAGMMGAAIRILYGARSATGGAGDKLAPIWSRPILFFSVVWVLINILAGLTGIGVPTSGPVFIAWVAHLGGYFAGLLFLDIFDALGPRRRTP